YVRASAGQSSLTEIPDASNVRIPSRIPRLLKAGASSYILLDSNNVVLIKLIALFSHGKSVCIPSQNVFASIQGYAPLMYSTREADERAEELRRAYADHAVPAVFDLHAPEGEDGKNRFMVNTTGAPVKAREDHVEVLRSLSGQSLFNRWHTHRQAE